MSSKKKKNIVNVCNEFNLYLKEFYIITWTDSDGRRPIILHKFLITIKSIC